MIRCDRCLLVLEDAHKGMFFTAGYYEVGHGNCWSKYANENEHKICDDCMWSDPRYIADYGDRSLIKSHLNL